MVNRAFEHPDYEIVKPKYHIFVDPSLATGQWPLEYLDIVYKKNPNVNLLLNAKWYHLEKFSKFRDKKNVYWIKNKSISLIFDNLNYDLTTIFASGAVVEQGLCLAIYSGSKKIYIHGVELNGIAYLMTGKESHFSGKDPDYNDHNSWKYARAMNCSSRSIRQWHRLNDNCKIKNIELINLSKSGSIDFIPKKNFEKIVADNKSKIAAIILEPLVQCAGGMKMHSTQVLSYIAGVAKKNDILFILDEIATGFGRTGTMFAYEQADIQSDIICLGKALTGGALSLSAVVTTRDVYEAFLGSDLNKALMHGPTYMANPLACAAANASIEIFKDEPRLEQVLNIEKIIKDRMETFSNFPGVLDVRSKGAIGVVQLKKIPDLNWLRNRFIEKGVWIRPFLDIIYIMPCFTIKEDELNQLLDAIEQIIPEWADKFYEQIK